MGSLIPGTPDRIGHHHLCRVLGAHGSAKSSLELDRLYRRSVQGRTLRLVIEIVVADTGSTDARGTVVTETADPSTGVQLPTTTAAMDVPLGVMNSRLYPAHSRRSRAKVAA